MGENEDGARIQIPGHLTFYHTIELAPGVTTPGWPAIVPTVAMIKEVMARHDWAGKKTLDVGCRDGALSFEAERLGSDDVLGIDFQLPLENLEFLKNHFSSRVKFEQADFWALRPDRHGVFDNVIFAGVLYHLRYPFSALRLLRDLVKVDGLLLLETATLALGNIPLMYCPTGTRSPYEPTSCTFFNIRGLTETLSSLGFDVEHVRSLANLPSTVSADVQDVRIDRTVLACRKMHLTEDEARILAYWDGDGAGGTVPSWKDRGG